MSTFAVFGVAHTALIETARKHGWYGDDAQKYAEEKFPGAKPRRLSDLFDAPQFAREYMELIQRAGPCRLLTIKSYGPILDAAGKPLMSKKTKKPRVGFTEYTGR